MKCRYCDFDLFTIGGEDLDKLIVEAHELGHKLERESIVKVIKREKYVSKKKLIEKIKLSLN